MPGVETSLALMLTAAMKGKCTVSQVVNWMSKNVAVAYGIPNKGAIAPGYDADLVLVDLNTYRPVRREELLTKCQVGVHLKAGTSQAGLQLPLSAVR